MSTTISDRRARFRALHAEGCFVLANPWDVGSARMLARMGFKALASTSSGACSAAIGKRDGELSLDEVLGHLRVMAASTDLPLNADFEAGFADEPEGVARNVALAVLTGVPRGDATNCVALKLRSGI